MSAEIIAFSIGLRSWIRNSENVCLESSRGRESRESVCRNRDCPASHEGDEPPDAPSRAEDRRENGWRGATKRATTSFPRRLKDQLNYVAVCLPLAIRHCPAIDIHPPPQSARTAFPSAC
jgi:hypothetical protein